jgi:hypothetical protein
VRTRHLSLVTSTHSVTTSSSKRALSPYGPVRAGLTISQTIQDQQLTELLNSLENVVANLNYRSFEVYDTLNIAIEAVSAALKDTQTNEDGTKL